MIRTSESTKAIDAAILQFQGAVEGVKRDAANSHFRNRYATLENVIDTARPALQEVGISFMQFPGAVVDGCLEVTTRLAHAESGEWICGTMQMPLGKRDPQGAGSAQTYAMRYSLMAVLGLPPTDDDAEGAIDRENKRQEPTGNQRQTQSSAALKRENFWPEFERELAECKTLVSLNAFKSAWKAKADKDGWTQTWREAAGDKIAFRSDEIKAAADDEFPGDLPSSVAHARREFSQHPANGG